MSPVSTLAEVLAVLETAFGEARMRWYLFGAQAVAVWGPPRLTADIDITVEASLDSVGDLVTRLGALGFAARADDTKAFANRTRVVPLTHRASGIPVDVVLAGPGLEQEFLDRARTVDVEGVPVPVISPEDLLVTKILAGRTKDLEDVRGVLAERHDELDLDRVRNLLGLLGQALDRDDLVPHFQRAIDDLPD